VQRAERVPFAVLEVGVRVGAQHLDQHALGDRVSALGQPDVGALPARDEADVIGNAIASLLEQDYGGRLDIVVVDDHSSDGTAEIRDAADGRLRSTPKLSIWIPSLDFDPASASDLPFTGGAIGYFSYDLARRFERLPALAADDEKMPEMASHSG
jgi:anthranilate/para-aminobenzoate synthase component I